MWAKRFPLIEFDYELLKELAWSAPAYLTVEEAQQRAMKILDGDDYLPGCFPVQVSDSFFKRFDIRGEFRHAILCVTPEKDVTVLGRSHAWKKQRLLIVDSLDPGVCNVIVDWRTARPMSTRLGPKDGITMKGGVCYAIFSNIVSDGFVGNRTLLDSETDKVKPTSGFSVCNLYVNW